MRYQWTHISVVGHQFIAMASHSCVVRAGVDRPNQPASQTDAFRLKFIVLRQILFNFITPLLSPKILCRRAATILPSISLAPTHSLSLPPRTNNKIRNMVSRDTPRGRMEYYIVQGYLSRRNCVCLTDTGIVKIS